MLIGDTGCFREYRKYLIIPVYTNSIYYCKYLESLSVAILANLLISLKKT